MALITQCADSRDWRHESRRYRRVRVVPRYALAAGDDSHDEIRCIVVRIGLASAVLPDMRAATPATYAEAISVPPMLLPWDFGPCVGCIHAVPGPAMSGLMLRSFSGPQLEEPMGWLACGTVRIPNTCPE